MPLFIRKYEIYDAPYAYSLSDVHYVRRELIWFQHVQINYRFFSETVNRTIRIGFFFDKITLSFIKLCSLSEEIEIQKHSTTDIQIECKH